MAAFPSPCTRCEAGCRPHTCTEMEVDWGSPLADGGTRGCDWDWIAAATLYALSPAMLLPFTPITCPGKVQVLIYDCAGLSNQQWTGRSTVPIQLH